jgi:hypothetical protein
MAFFILALIPESATADRQGLRSKIASDGSRFKALAFKFPIPARNFPGLDSFFIRAIFTEIVL